MEALQEVIDRIPKDYTVDLTTEQFNIVDKINLIMETLEENQSATFISLFPAGGSKGEVIATFLAILELCKMLLIRVNQSEEGVIRVYLPPEGERKELGRETLILSIIPGKRRQRSPWIKTRSNRSLRH